MSEFTPTWRKIKMSKSQVKKYIQDLEEKRKAAQAKLDAAKKSPEWEKEENEIAKLEDLVDNIELA